MRSFKTKTAVARQVTYGRYIDIMNIAFEGQLAILANAHVRFPEKTFKILSKDARCLPSMRQSSYTN